MEVRICRCRRRKSFFFFPAEVCILKMCRCWLPVLWMSSGIWTTVGRTVKARYAVRKASLGSTVSIVLTEQMSCRCVFEYSVFNAYPAFASWFLSLWRIPAQSTILQLGIVILAVVEGRLLKKKVFNQGVLENVAERFQIFCHKYLSDVRHWKLEIFNPPSCRSHGNSSELKISNGKCFKKKTCLRDKAWSQVSYTDVAQDFRNCLWS